MEKLAENLIKIKTKGTLPFRIIHPTPKGVAG